MLKNKTNLFLYAICCFLLLLLGMNFFNLSRYIFLLIFFVSFAFIIFNFIEVKKYFFNLLFFLIALFSLTLSITSSIFNLEDISKNIYHFFAIPITFYLISIMEKVSGKNKLLSLISLFFGLYLYGALDMSYTYSFHGMNFHDRYLFDVWTKEARTCTILSLYLLPFTGCATFFLLQYRKKVYIIIPCLVIILLSFYFSASAVNRGFFLAYLLSLIILLFYREIKNYNLHPRRFNILISIILIVLFIFLLIQIMYSNNVFGVRDTLEKFPLFKRIFGADFSGQTGRIHLYQLFFANAWKYPFGGMYVLHEVEGLHYVHNIWFDIYYIGGLFPFAIYVYIHIFIIINLFYNLLNNPYKKLQLMMFLPFTLISFIEPTIFANPYFFSSFFCFAGLCCYEENKKSYICRINEKNNKFNLAGYNKDLL